VNAVCIPLDDLVSIYSSTSVAHLGIEKAIVNRMAPLAFTHTVKKLAGMVQVVMTVVCACILCGSSFRNQQILFYTCAALKICSQCGHYVVTRGCMGMGHPVL
jgi:hypothetical protein